MGAAGRPGLGAQRSTVQAGRLAANGTRLWIYCGNGTPTDPALASPDAPIGGLGFLEGMAIDSNHAFADAYVAAAVTTPRSIFRRAFTAGGIRASSCSR